MASVNELILPGDTARAADASPRPMIVVDDAHVTYRVYASGKRINARDGLFSLRTLRGGRGLKTVPALRGVTFTASEGETIGVIGHNGSGKSTLFRAMTGLIPTSEGTIWARDRPVLLGVNAALVPELSGENNIKLGLLAMGFTPAEAAARVDEIADFAELNEFIHHPMRTYSSGMGARLRFAIASAKAHSILLVDEALSVGDRRFKLKSEARIRELRDSAGLVMIVSHSVNSLKDTCDRVLWIHKGELRADGPAEDVIRDYVRWTKQPGAGAVGAASAVKAKQTTPPQKRKPSVTEAAAAAAAGEGAARAAAPTTGGSALDDLLKEASREPNVKAPAGRTEPTDDTKPAVPQPDGPRAAARRERYHRAARERTKRRMLAVGISSLAILLAIAAGAAIALVAGIPPAPEQGSTPAAQITPASDASKPASILSFSAESTTVACATNDEDTSVRLSWEVAGVTRVALAAGATELDAIEDPLETDLPALAIEHAAPFPCAEETRVYTLTVQGGDDARISAVVTVTRAIEPETEPESQTPQQGVNPVAPGRVPESQPTTQPLPSTQPAPSPTAPPQPEPEPEPEPQPEPPIEPEPELPPEQPDPSATG